MKNFKIFIFCLVLFPALIIACQDDSNDLGNTIDKSTLKYEITPQPGNNNMVILKSFTPDVIPFWSTPNGVSRALVDTVLLPFSGTYKFCYAAQGQGGLTVGDTVVVNVATDNLAYVSGPLWEALTGGAGNSKTWILDNGKYGLGVGPISYADPGREQVWGNYKTNWDRESVEGQTEEDLQAEMTFALIGGAQFTTVKPNEPGGNESGVFTFNPDNHTLSTSGATIVRVASFIDNASNWTNDLNILELTENQLRIAVLRTNSEGPWWYIMNYVSKEYAENYVPEPTGPDKGFDPKLKSGELLSMLTGGEASGRVWRLDGKGNPVDWIVGGNGWTSKASDSYDWGWNDNWAAAAANSWIRFEQYDGNQTYTLSQKGVITTSSFTIDETNNEITLGGANTLIQDGGNGSSINPTTNVIKVVKAFPDSYTEDGIWFGTKYKSEKDEWVAFHYVLE
ncbi:hypothetical protein [Fulvivirga sediminis]|uniref:Uncharacterized protein n=1 Tax=Fulvivirga sediminis TaxID=2803949 RepID=A0A937JZS7_9BACT|nr:hypothetical protein [Fulvivirga sediminis]MBL3655600.1 hypothetical protein [Fulvivirga sediminis]